MTALEMLSLLAMLPAVYPLFYIFKKRDLNLFDLVILFHTLNYAVTPFKNGYLKVWDNDVVFTLFCFYISFILLILFFDIFWHTFKSEEVHIINITKFLGQYRDIKLSVIAQILLALGLICSLTFYMPIATLTLHTEETGIDTLSYEMKATSLMFSTIWDFMGIVFSFILVNAYKTRNFHIVDLGLAIVYFILLLFFPRRTFLLGILVLVLVLYSVYREGINKKFLLTISFLGVFFYLVYFPFYNVMRRSDVSFDASHPFSSLMELVSYANDNWSSRYREEKKEDTTGKRSLGLYEGIYSLIASKPLPKNGTIAVATVDFAIPKVLNPHKGMGPEPILEKMTNRNVDIADSVLLYTYGDFNYFGFIFAGLIYYAIFLLYNLYAKIWERYFHVNLIPLFLAFTMISLAWNIEGNIGVSISFLFSSFIFLLIIFALERSSLNIINLEKNDDTETSNNEEEYEQTNNLY